MGSQSPHPRELDALVIGGGPAGSAAAIELALAGRRVALLERTQHPHDKVCGDFLSAEALASLTALGLNPNTLGALPIHRICLASSLGVSTATLPFAAQSLPRRTLDESLLNRARTAGALILRGHTAESLHHTHGLWHVNVTTAGRTFTLTAPNILLATGKHDLRGLPRPATASHPALIGLKLYLRLTATQARELDDTIELALLPHGYAGLSLVEGAFDAPRSVVIPPRVDGHQNPVISTAAQRSGETCISGPAAPAHDTANLCFVLPRDLLRRTGHTWPELARFLTRNPHLRARLTAAEPLLPHPLAISPIPYGLLRREALAPTLFALGDQTAVIPSFTGDGLALALHTGRLAARFLLDGRTADDFHHELHAQLRRQITLATTLSRALLTQPARTAIEVTARLIPSTLRTIAHHTRLAPQHQLPAHPLAAAHKNSRALA